MRRKSKDEKLWLLVKFYLLTGRVPSRYEKYEGVNIGEFWSNINRPNIKGYDEDIEVLKKIGLKLNKIRKEDEILNQVEILIKFFKEYNREPKIEEQYMGNPVGRFYRKVLYNQMNIPRKYRQMLEERGIRVNIGIKQQQVHEKVKLLIEFYMNYNRLPQIKELYQNIKIGKFYVSIKNGGTAISESDREKLICLGILKY